ncbi:TonB-dependent siderophore receptor [Xylophilus sp.]|uniref:TonB-dependent siderophore receptor n=1 Tax=Xylophilus sp. TaxID=2653893 RepID=UPI0013BCBCC8|nr:TonB-dependent siderophore receptor [Xylophilus sp.]KAF1048421.1 MAG: Ferric enterobactin receptor [Xylophilus sp.]
MRSLPLPRSLPLSPLAAAAALALCTAAAHAADATLSEVQVVGTAEQELKQAPGVSVITAEDIEKRPPANDLAETIRTQPGVNLTGNSTSGQRGNNRQIDIRGMGPENTLVLIDGRPVTSRNSVRYGWRGERDTRGDTNWVPAEEVERIEVIRGPAAARYGNGAAGGVVNIITKGPAKETHGSITFYANQPTHSADGKTRRTTFDLGGPLGEDFSYRLYGNVNKTDADAADINKDHAYTRTGTQAGSYPAGREGVRNRDLAGRLSWRLGGGHTLDLDAGFSRQGNIYAGNTQNTNSNTLVTSLVGAETNRMYRENFALTHKGKYDFGTSLSYLQYTSTRNTRYNEGLAGGVEGIFCTFTSVYCMLGTGISTARLKDYTLHSEVNVPSRVGGYSQVFTLGAEAVHSTLTDPNSLSLSTSSAGAITGVSATGRDTGTSGTILSVFAEDNIGLSDSLILTPGLRFDHHTQSGSNWSPALNLSKVLAENWTVKAGIARAYKAPNLYQSNPNYVLYSAGQGCWGGTGSYGCYLLGNSSLKPETSVNKELGIEYRNGGLLAGLTWFRNDYRNKIDAGQSVTGTTGSSWIYQWTNVPRALVQGFEGTFKLPLSRTVDWSNNFTYMTDSVNKTTGEVLSIIPKYTLNSTLEWRATGQLGLQATVTAYGRQKPKKYDFYGNLATGTATAERAPYALVGVSGNYRISKNLRLTAGISNLFDKRLYRRGNTQTVNNIPGAGAETYNEPGRAFYASLTASF